MLVCLLIGTSGVSSSLFEAYSSTSGMELRTAQYIEDTSGFRVAYLLEAVFFLWLILGNYDKVGEDRKQTVLLNVALVFCGILLLFIRSENGGRLGWFFIMALIGTLTTSFLRSHKKRFNRVQILVLVFFLYVRIAYIWGIRLSPYKTFFTDGVRSGDVIYEKYEYDPNYALDKFYR